MNYLITANLVFSVFFVLYMVALKRLTFFHLNRFYLLFSLVFSACVPLFPNVFVAQSNVLPVVVLPEMVVNATTSPELQPVWQVTTWVYWLGVAVGVLLLFKALHLIQHLQRNAKAVKNYFVSQGHHAFSFFNRIQIGDRIGGDVRDMILAHEWEHRRQWHSLDVVLFSMARILAWFNPLVHLAAKEMQLNHEFLADRVTVRRFGTDYQYTLLNQALDTQLFPLTNSFFSKSMIKNRITMMNKNHSRKWSVAMYALIIPAVVGSLWMSSCSEQAGIPDSQQKMTQLQDAIKPSDKVNNAKEVDKLPEFPGGKEGMLNYFKEGFEYPESLKADGIEGRVTLAFVVNEDGTLSDFEAVKTDHELLAAPAIEFVKGMPDWIPGEKDGEQVKVQMMLPVQYTMN